MENKFLESLRKLFKNQYRELSRGIIFPPILNSLPIVEVKCSPSYHSFILENLDTQLDGDSFSFDIPLVARMVVTKDKALVYGYKMYEQNTDLVEEYLKWLEAPITWKE